MAGSDRWFEEILLSPSSGWPVIGTWPQLKDRDGTPIEFDDRGIIRGKRSENTGVEFHELMETGTTLRRLEDVQLHLAKWETPFYRHRIDRYLDSIEPLGRVIDIGCGDGRFTRQLIQRGVREIVCVDVNLNSLRSLADHATEEGFRDQLLLIHCDATSIPIADGSVDVAIAIESLYYLNEKFEDGLAEAVRLVRKGGSVIDSEPAIEGAALKSVFFEDLDDFVSVINERRFTEVTNGQTYKFRALDWPELESTYTELGLSILDTQRLSVFPLLVRMGLVRGQFTPEKIAAQEPELLQVFDYFDGLDAGATKTMITHCRKS